MLEIGEIVMEQITKTRYSFEWYLKEHCRYGWLSPLNTSKSIKEKYYNEYLKYCQNKNLIADTTEKADEYLFKYRTAE